MDTVGGISMGAFAAIWLWNRSTPEGYDPECQETMETARDIWRNLWPALQETLEGNHAAAKGLLEVAERNASELGDVDLVTFFRRWRKALGKRSRHSPPSPTNQNGSWEEKDRCFKFEPSCLDR